MSNKTRNIDILKKIIGYCNEIAETEAYFGNSFEVFKANSIYRNAVAMCILQIGEISGLLTDEFKAKYDGVPWKNIKGMRNIMAHKYGSIDITTLWETVENDIKVLKKYCEDILREYLLFQQEAQALDLDEDELER